MKNILDIVDKILAEEKTTGCGYNTKITLEPNVNKKNKKIKMRKQLLLIPFLLLMVSCEKQQSWLVTKTSTVSSYKKVNMSLIQSKTTKDTEIYSDMTENEIIELCEANTGVYFEEQGTVVYKYANEWKYTDYSE